MQMENGLELDVHKERTAMGLFEEVCAHTPATIAAVAGEATITFAGLDTRSNQVAHFLLRQGVTREEPVGLLMAPSIELLEMILGVMKAGAAYLPLDPAYPAERLNHMVVDSGAIRIFSCDGAGHACTNQKFSVINLALCRSNIDEMPTTAPARDLRSEGVAYVIYTSGSTGSPKGVMGTHGSVANRIAIQGDLSVATSNEVWLQKTSIGFVDSVFEILCALCTGATLVIANSRDISNPEYLTTLIHTNRVTRWVTVPSLARLIVDLGLIDGNFDSLRNWTLSGEVLDLLLAQKLSRRLPNATILNLYGSSEVAADATAYQVTGMETEYVPIGKALRGVVTHVLTERLEKVAAGKVGELFVGGAGLARGYIGKPAMTAERFVPDPFGVGARLYRTGDMVRMSETGDLVFVGRLDQQVNVNGYRIELGEIEAAALLLNDVRAAAALLTGLDHKSKRVVCYVQLALGSSLSTQDIMRHLQCRLPRYMLPHQVLTLDELPVTVNGKLDRLGLSAVEGATGGDYLLHKVPGSQTGTGESQLDAESEIYYVVRNLGGQYSLLPVQAAVPPGWERIHSARLRIDCLHYIDDVWHDLRPSTIR